MANRAVHLPFLVSSKELLKHLQPKSALIRSNQVFFSSSNNAQGDGASEVTKAVEESVESVSEAAETAWDATKKTVEKVVETTTAEADTNVVDTAEYRSAEDLRGQLGDGCDHKIEL
ncbi:hypothetical protein PIB30_049074 [Stylosanthes scabra]|uniref:Uncharacterized protein n=1 Tax=Stylosanthes scabra TaxID=79078 RepID=A0ABU6YFU5_9FABA|nr:hypothetical protein [Stylosanthes scabra]